MNEPDPIRGLGPWALFRRDLARVWAACRFDWRLPVLVLGLSLVAGVPGVVGIEIDAPWLGFVGLAITVMTLGVLGAERLWFVAADRREHMSWADVREFSRTLWRRYLGLGIYASCLLVVAAVITAVPFVIVASVVAGGDTELKRAILRVGLLFLLFVVDFVFTFATPAIAFADLSAGDAVRHSWHVIRVEWPFSRWYALAAPLALEGLAFAFPAQSVGVGARIVLLLVHAIIRLFCIGAVVLFYVDRYVETDIVGEAKS